MTTPPRPDDPVRSPAELTGWWARLLDPPVSRRRDLWTAWITATGRLLPTVVPVEDVPLAPDLPTVRGLVDLHVGIARELLGPGGHLALALCRPGGAGPRQDDAVWAEVLRGALHARLEETWSLHLAAGGTVTALVVPPDGRLGG